MNLLPSHEATVIPSMKPSKFQEYSSLSLYPVFNMHLLLIQAPLESKPTSNYSVLNLFYIPVYGPTLILMGISFLVILIWHGRSIIYVA